MSNKNVEKQKRIYKILDDAELKKTPARIDTLNLFSGNCHPMSAEEIFKFLKKRYDLATIYRNLSALEEKKILSKVNLRSGSVHYEVSNMHHHHIVCTSCGKVEEFSNCNIKRTISNVLSESKNFKKIDEHALELFGVCKTCGVK